MPSRDSFLTDCGLRYETIVYLSDESNTPFNDVYAAFLFLYCAKLNVMSTFMSLNRVKGYSRPDKSWTSRAWQESPQHGSRPFPRAGGAFFWPVDDGQVWCFQRSCTTPSHVHALPWTWKCFSRMVTKVVMRSLLRITLLRCMPRRKDTPNRISGILSMSLLNHCLGEQKQPRSRRSDKGRRSDQCPSYTLEGKQQWSRSFARSWLELRWFKTKRKRKIKNFLKT